MFVVVGFVALRVIDFISWKDSYNAGSVGADVVQVVPL
jgi:hypothetical protein